MFLVQQDGYQAIIKETCQALEQVETQAAQSSWTTRSKPDLYKPAPLTHVQARAVRVGIPSFNKALQDGIR